VSFPLTNYYNIPTVITESTTAKGLSTTEIWTTLNDSVTIEMQKYSGLTVEIGGETKQVYYYQFQVDFTVDETDLDHRTNQIWAFGTVTHPTAISGYQHPEVIVSENSYADGASLNTLGLTARQYRTTKYFPTDEPLPTESEAKTHVTEYTYDNEMYYRTDTAHTNLKYWYDKTQSQWVLGTYLPGEWVDSVPSYDRTYPPFEPDLILRRFVDPGGGARPYVQVYHYFFVDETDPTTNTYGQAYVYVNPSDPDHYYNMVFERTATTKATGSIVLEQSEYVEDSVIAEKEKYMTAIPTFGLMPNLTDIQNNSFYILDGTTAQVDVGPNEIIDNRRKFKKTIEDKKTRTTGIDGTYHYTGPCWDMVYNIFYRSFNGKTSTKTHDRYLTLPPDNKRYLIYAALYQGDQSTGTLLTESVTLPTELSKTRYKPSSEDIQIKLQDMTLSGGTSITTTTTSEEVLYDIPVSSSGTTSTTIPTEYHYNSQGTTGITYGSEQQEAEWWYIESSDTSTSLYSWVKGKPLTLPSSETVYTTIPDITFDPSWAQEPIDQGSGRYEYDYFIPLVPMTLSADFWRYERWYNDVDLTHDNAAYSISHIITETIEYDPEEGAIDYEGNKRLTFSWNNLPMVVMSPIQSIVLTLQGMDVNQEYQPINASDFSGSALTSSIPVIENFYSLAQSLRDLHDELVIVKDSYSDTATYTLATTSGQERSITLSAKYITKDGKLHQIYIPPKGVFSLQLTFGISFYFAG